MTEKRIKKSVSLSVVLIGLSPKECVHGDPDNLESLRDKREKGNYRKATEEYIQLLLDIVEKELSELGYDFGRWTAQRLSTHLAEKTGIKLSSTQVRRILKERNYVYLWAKSSLESKQNPPKRKAFKKKLKRYLSASEAEPDKLQVWFWDESGFSLRVIRRKSWIKKGKKKKVAVQRIRGIVNVMRAVRFHDKKRLCYFVKKGDSQTFYEQLEQLNEAVKKEWIEQGIKKKNSPRKVRKF